VAFFVVLGALNLYVVANFSMETWVNFKVFGIMGLTLVFALAQGVYLMRFDQSADSAANDD
jgi:intracellular septation protein